jgi:hypothetical protein
MSGKDQSKHNNWRAVYARIARVNLINKNDFIATFFFVPSFSKLKSLFDYSSALHWELVAELPH